MTFKIYRNERSKTLVNFAFPAGADIQVPDFPDERDSDYFFYAAQIEFTDSVSGKTIEGLELILDGRKYTTDITGMISIPEITGGTYILTITNCPFEFTENPVIEILSDSLFRIQ